MTPVGNNLWNEHKPAMRNPAPGARIMSCLAVCALLLLCPVYSIQANDSSLRKLPDPADASRELLKEIREGFTMPWDTRPENNADWRRLVAKYASISEGQISQILEKLEIKCESASIGNVPVFILEPPEIPERNRNCVLLYFHGGGYVFNPGKLGLGEGIYMAAISKFKVISVDYRLAPEHPFPAALDDAVKVYRELLKSYSPGQIGVFGSSTGGGMTLASCLLAKRDGLPMPGTIAPGSPWADLSKTGDSYYINDHIDIVLVSHDGILDAMARAYENGHDLKEQLLSPVYGDIPGFPPTILGTGTRDLFLSNAARVHRKLREAGVEAELLVIEGLSHWQYILLPPDAPETRYYFGEVAKFFEKHLSK